MVERCAKHPFETVESHCRTCGLGYCNECLVYSYGPKKPPYCVQCALVAAGVRRSGPAPAVRAQKSRRLFGGRKPEPVVEVAPLGFDDIPIEFPEGYEMSPAARRLRGREEPEVFLDPEPAFIEPVLVGADAKPAADTAVWTSQPDDSRFAASEWPTDSRGLGEPEPTEHWTESTAAPWPSVNKPSTGSF